MSNETKKTALPKLRFPEFREAEEWEGMLLNEISSLITKGTTPTSVGFQFTESGITFIKIESLEKGGQINLSKVAFISAECDEILKRSRLKENDVLFSIAGALGVIAVVTEKVLPANTNQALALIRLKEGQNYKYLSYFLNSESIQQETQKLRAGAAQPNISLGQLGNFEILLPSLPEQQKIAAALSSLDDLLTAQSARLAALQAHKRGLLQGLFPAEGETVPKLRFPEFQQAPEWEEKTLGEVADIKRGAASQHLNYIDNCHNAVRLLRINDFLSNTPVYVEDTEEMKRYRVKNGDLLIAGTGATAGIVFLVPERFNNLAYSYNAPRIRVRNGNKYFLYYYLQSDYIIKQQQRLFTGNAQPFLDTKAIGSFCIKIPSLEEQQKIDDCLTSLNTHITAQTQKIEALQLHKKGLMQGLFPAAAEPAA